MRVASIDGPVSNTQQSVCGSHRVLNAQVVRLELEGACGTCPSSTMTMKMGLERRLKEVIPEISDVVQALPSVRVSTSSFPARAHFGAFFVGT